MSVEEVFTFILSNFFSVKLHKLHFSKLIEEARKSMKIKAKGKSISTGESETSPKEKEMVLGKPTDSTDESDNRCSEEIVPNKPTSVEKENSVVTEAGISVEDGGIVAEEVNVGYDDNHSSLKSSTSTVQLRDISRETTTEPIFNKQLNSQTVAASGKGSNECSEKDNIPPRFTESPNASKSAILTESELSNNGSEELMSSPLFGSDTASPFKTQVFIPDEEKVLEPLKDGEVFTTRDPVLPCVSSDSGDSSLAFEKENEAYIENQVTEPPFDLLSSFDNFGNFFFTNCPFQLFI